MTADQTPVPSRRFPGRTARWLALLMVGVVGLALLDTSSTTVALDHPSQASQAGVQPAFTRDHGPLLRGMKVTLEEALKIVSFPIRRPTHALANDALIRAVFVEVVPDDLPGAVGEQVVIDYESGIVLYLDVAVGELADDPRGSLEAELRELPPQARLTQVHGRPALAIPSATDSGESAASVILVVDGVRVVLQARYAPLDWQMLAEAADTI